MNFPNNCNAIMFHHFHDSKLFKRTQGSITENFFEKKLKKLIKLNYKFLSPKEWMEKYKKNKLLKKEICLTFDDGLLSQYNIALPVLNKLKIKAFWFIFSGPISNQHYELEIFRKYRAEYFYNIKFLYSFF